MLGECDLTVPAKEYAQQHRYRHQPRAEPAVEALLALIKMLHDLPPIAVRTDSRRPGAVRCRFTDGDEPGVKLKAKALKAK